MHTHTHKHTHTHTHTHLAHEVVEHVHVVGKLAKVHGALNILQALLHRRHQCTLEVRHLRRQAPGPVSKQDSCEKLFQFTSGTVDEHTQTITRK
jgi:hypothetical protein